MVNADNSLADNHVAQRFWTEVGYVQVDVRPDLAKGGSIRFSTGYRA